MKTHGMYGTRLNSIWANMRNRCNCKTNKDYNLYGARGIKVCKEWDKFENFYKWSIENGYSENLSIDRINVDDDYKPSNCRWITMKEQQANKRNNVYIEYNGETHTISEWSRITGIPRSKLEYRHGKGMCIDEIFNPGRSKANVKVNHYTYKGKDYTTTQILEQFGLTMSQFKCRLNRGWSIEEAIEGERDNVRV